jgi:hypothetical protein
MFGGAASASSTTASSAVVGAASVSSDTAAGISGMVSQQQLGSSASAEAIGYMAE